LTTVVSLGEGKQPVTGPLLGDASVRNVLAGLRNEMVKITGEDGVRALADLGITTEKDGKLKLDDAKLTSVIDNNFDKIGSYLAGENGLMGRLAASVNGYVATGGVLKQRTDTLQGTLTNIDTQRKELELRVEKIQTRLYAQYNAMDSLVGQLKRTSESLTNQLASLPGFVKND
jgi:flagellar hook-associated protein 2